MSDLTTIIGGVAAYKVMDHYITSANARLQHQDNQQRLEYLKKRDCDYSRILSQQNERRLSQTNYENFKRRELEEKLARDQRYHIEAEAERDRYHEEEMQRREHEMREAELYVERENIRSQNYIAELNAKTQIYNADLDREARIAMQARQLDQNEQLELRRLRVMQNIASQQEELQKHLFERGIQSAQELEKFKALANRETQILLSRENAANVLQDRMVQDALKNFPLNISPLVLLRNRPHSLTGLLRFSSINSDSNILPNIIQVYGDVKNYSLNPEALNVFIAPLHISSSIRDRETLSSQIWDYIYEKVESFFTNHYNRRGDHPVILYPTAWKDSSSAGQHASETLHFFLKDMPCIVIEPRFDGHNFNIMVSSWGIGYLSTDHIRTEIKFDVNLYSSIIEAVYKRSKQSLSVFEDLQEEADDFLREKIKGLKQNVSFYEKLNLSERIKNNKLEEIETLGIYDLFHIEPNKDLKEAVESIASLLCINLAVLSDLHHLQSTDANPLFPKLFNKEFPKLFEDKNLRENISKCYEQVFIFLRNQDSQAVDSSKRKEMERAREMQITNLKKDLELIDEQDLMDSMEEKLRKYAEEKYNITGIPFDELWSKMVEMMDVNDIPFFMEILPNIEDRRLYKRIDKKIAELQRI